MKPEQTEVEMNVWWLAIDNDHTSYQELKMRGVIAQGWRQLGDLRTLCGLNNQDLFKGVIRELAVRAYGENEKSEQPGTVMWNLFQGQPGDLYVGIEGTTTRGIAQLPLSGAFTYRFDPQFEYGQTIGYPVKWIEWDPTQLGLPPTAPAQSVLGIRKIQNERDRIIDAWIRLTSK